MQVFRPSELQALGPQILTTPPPGRPPPTWSGATPTGRPWPGTHSTPPPSTHTSPPCRGGANGEQGDVVLPWTYELFYYGLIAIDLEDNMMTYISSGCITGIALIILPIVVLSLRISGSQKHKPRREMSRDTS